MYVLGEVKEGDVPDGKRKRTVFGWSEKGAVTSGLNSESYKELLATGRGEKRVSGTKPYEESKLRVLENIRRASTDRAGSGGDQGQIVPDLQTWMRI